MQVGKFRVHSRLVPVLACAILVLAALLPLTQAGAMPRPDLPGGNTFLLSEQDDGRRVELQQGEVLVISLKGNPSTGYLWQVVQADERIVREVGNIQFEPESDLLGAPATMTRRFEAVGPGQSDLVLAYRRPWEDSGPTRTFAIQVEGVGAFTPGPAPVEPAIASISEPAFEQPAISGARPEQALPSSYNWCDLGGCTPVKNQGNCGSCWAFGTVGPFESLIKLNDGLTRDLSEQYLVSCNTDGWGCDGGWWAHNYHQWKVPDTQDDAGAVYESDFPYVASDATCIPSLPHNEKISSWHFVGSQYSVPPAADIKQAIYDHGPVAVALCVNDAFGNYNGGVFGGPGCTELNHAVVLVGWDDSLGTGGAWRLRNSWGEGWGEGGYMWIEYGVSMVGYSANYVVYEGGLPPAAPGNLQAAPASRTRINLSWTDNSSNESGFRIERSLNGSNGWAEIDTVGPNVRTYGDEGLGSSTTYHYRVQAYNASGDSSYTGTASAKTFGQFTTTVYVPLVVRGEGGSPGWTTLLSEDLEDAFPGTWTVLDNDGASYGEYHWAKRDCEPYGGSYSGWAVGGGAAGSALSCGADYPNNADSWMIYGPFSLADATAAELTFKLWLSSESGFDYFYWGASTNGSNFYVWSASGATSGWTDRVLDLANVPTLGDLRGEANVWIALIFQSDFMVTEPVGAYVDDIVLRKQVGMSASLPRERVAPDPAGLGVEPAMLTLER
jgi:predicted secreted protein